ncbi:hemin uptake protein HemP [Cognatishimia sp.]|uniref:hemin uptake protein HemP n=1 Tax=Cognatishimia sp. TaxID=2211648 RepID=UPI0035162174|nr:hemin uptake protein HemP [Cognatishimia sp.]
MSLQDPIPPKPSSIPYYNAKAILGRGGEARIMLDDKIYTLRITHAGKLILTK